MIAYHGSTVQIEQGLYGIDNMDYKYLANDLIENEPELFYNKFPKEQGAI